MCYLFYGLPDEIEKREIIHLGTWTFLAKFRQFELAMAFWCQMRSWFFLYDLNSNAFFSGVRHMQSCCTNSSLRRWNRRPLNAPISCAKRRNRTSKSYQGVFKSKQRNSVIDTVEPTITLQPHLSRAACSELQNDTCKSS